MRPIFQKGLHIWLNQPLMTKGMIVISIPVICILFFTGAVYLLQKQRADVSQWIDRAFRAGSGLQGIVTRLVDAESGIRGFLLTREKKYLQSYRTAKERLPPQLSRLEKDLGDSPVQAGRIKQLALLVNQRLDILGEFASLPGSSSVGLQLDADRKIMESIEKQIDAIRGDETRLWIVRVAEEAQSRKNLLFASYAAAILGLLSGGLAMALFVTGIAKRSQLLTANASRLVRGEPLQNLPPGKDEIGILGDALLNSSQLLTERENELRSLNRELDHRVQERTAQLEQETAERKRYEEQLLQSQKMDAIGRLAGGIAHDFNNALSIILGYGQLLQAQISHAPHRKMLDEMARAAGYASSLTKQLLSFSRNQVASSQSVDLNAAVEEAEKLLQRLLGEDIELQTVKSRGLLRMRADAGQIAQVILNLAINARDAMPRGGKLTIQTENIILDEAYCRQHIHCTPGRNVMLIVTDSGCGMSDEVRERIFEPFFTTKEKGTGTGLGLSVVYGIVKKFGGSIWVYSQPGVGTTFKLYFPVDDADDHPNPIAPTLSVERSTNGAILVVDDNPSIRSLLIELLGMSGYKALEAGSLEQALRLIREQPVALLITDVIMPGASGRELADALQQEQPSLKVLYMSGYTDDALARHGVLDSGLAFLEKPFTAENLAAKVQSTMHGPS